MLSLRIKNVHKVCNYWCLASSQFHNSPPRFLDKKWRAAEGLPKNPNSFGPLTNLPDYTFSDGRPTPIGVRLTKRIRIQRETAQKIVTMNNELQFAKDRYKAIQLETELTKQNILKNKLKPKGYLLTKK